MAWKLPSQIRVDKSLNFDERLWAVKMLKKIAASADPRVYRDEQGFVEPLEDRRNSHLDGHYKVKPTVCYTNRNVWIRIIFTLSVDGKQIMECDALPADGDINVVRIAPRSFVYIQISA